LAVAAVVDLMSMSGGWQGGLIDLLVRLIMGRERRATHISCVHRGGSWWTSCLITRSMSAYTKAELVNISYQIIIGEQIRSNRF
jgi:hypothetical protein